jgi:acyl-CoA thioesterase FadM
MGNDRYHSFMDLGRLDLAFRSGWINNLYKRGWQPQVVGCFASYHQPLRLFDHFVLRTYVVHVNGASMWLAHHFEKDGIVYHSALSKMVAVSGLRVVPLTSFVSHPVEREKWSSQRNVEQLFKQGNALLKELASFSS